MGRESGQDLRLMAGEWARPGQVIAGKWVWPRENDREVGSFGWLMAGELGGTQGESPGK